MTVSNIDCDFDAQVTNAPAENETGTTVFVGVDAVGTTTTESMFRFPLSATITASSTINDTDIQINVTARNAGNDAGDQIDFTDYGTSNPDTDSAATKLSNTNGGAVYASISGLTTTGSKTADLGTSADTDVQNQITSPGWLTVGIKPGTGLSNNEGITIEAIENAGTDPATLTVDWTAPSASVVPTLGLMGVGT